MPEAVTLFSWGYKGWGNATDKLIEAVDAVERSRGRAPLVFVDVRARRGGRAEGFKENTFRDHIGADRYRWIKGLGNRTVLERGGPQGRLVDPAEAEVLLGLALELQRQNRRVIYYCSCAIPASGCHRHWIAPELFKAARKRGVEVTVVEWPGTEPAPKKRPVVELDERTIGSIIDGKLKNVPLTERLPPVDLLALPWLQIVDLSSGDSQARVASGPAEYRAGHWQLPILGPAWDLKVAMKEIANAKEQWNLMPRTGARSSRRTA